VTGKPVDLTLKLGFDGRERRLGAIELGRIHEDARELHSHAYVGDRSGPSPHPEE
jgi:hypothetical protein